jgi:hypothetical protein
MFSVMSRDYGSWVNGILVKTIRLATDSTLNKPGGGTYVPVKVTVSYQTDGSLFNYTIKNGIKIVATVPYKLSYGQAATPDLFQFKLLDAGGSTVLQTIDVNFADVPTLADLARWLNRITGVVATVIGPSYFPSCILDSYAGSAILPGQSSSDTFFQAEEASMAYQLWSNDPLIMPSPTYTIPTPDNTSAIQLPTPVIENWSSSLYAAMFQAGVPGALPGSSQGDGIEHYLANGAGSQYDNMATDSVGLTRALNLAASTECAYIWAQSVDSDVQNALLMHAEAMSDVTKEKYRIFITGINFTSTSPVDGAETAAATVDAAVTAAIARGPLLAGPCVFCFDGSKYPSPINGNVEQLGGLGLAAQVLGMAAGMAPAQPLTNKIINCQGLEFPILSDAQIDELLAAGVTFPFFDETDGNFKLMQALTTYQTNDSAFRLLQGLRIQHTVCRLELSVLAEFKGQPLDLEVGERIKAKMAAALDKSILSGGNPNGFLTEGKQNGVTLPAWDSLTVTGDTSTGLWVIDVNLHPVGETDYILVRNKFLPTIIQL